jgi:predicted XRE-type DNA-binding protein
MASRNVEWTELVTRGTENVFADLGFPDAAGRQARLRLAYALNQVLEARKLSQAPAAEALAVSLPSLSALRHYRLAGFSLERLMHLLTAVDFDVEIVIRKKPRSRKAARIKVRQSPRPLPSPAKPHRPTLR